VSDIEWPKQNAFIRSVIDSLDVDRFSVGYIQFAREARTEFPIEKGRTKEELKVFFFSSSKAYSLYP